MTIIIQDAAMPSVVAAGAREQHRIFRAQMKALQPDREIAIYDDLSEQQKMAGRASFKAGLLVALAELDKQENAGG